MTLKTYSDGHVQSQAEADADFLTAVRIYAQMPGLERLNRHVHDALVPFEPEDVADAHRDMADEEARWESLRAAGPDCADDDATGSSA